LEFVGAPGEVPFTMQPIIYVEKWSRNVLVA